MKLYTPSRISRRLGEKFFFKAERDMTAKSAMVRRPYPPGVHGKRGSRASSEFGTELKEKQKVRYLYGISDKVLKKYVGKAAQARSGTKTEALYKSLERRLDNAVFRLGLAPSRRISRQMVSHGHLEVNGRPVRTPSIGLRPGDQVAVRQASRGKMIFEGLALKLKKHQPPSWLSLDVEAMSGAVQSLPSLEEDNSFQNLSKVIEYYSR